MTMKTTMPWLCAPGIVNYIIWLKSKPICKEILLLFFTLEKEKLAYKDWSAQATNPRAAEPRSKQKPLRVATPSSTQLHFHELKCLSYWSDPGHPTLKLLNSGVCIREDLECWVYVCVWLCVENRYDGFYCVI